MPQACAAYNCRTVKITADTSLHLFPKDEVLKEKWIMATRRTNWKPSKFSTLCSKHFEPYWFKITPAGKRFLSKGAVPSIFDYSDRVRKRPWAKHKPRKTLTVESDEENIHEASDSNNDGGTLPQISNYYSLNVGSDTLLPEEASTSASEPASLVEKEDGCVASELKPTIDEIKFNCFKPVGVELFTESNEEHIQGVEFMSIDEIKLEPFSELNLKDEKHTFEEMQTTSNLVTEKSKIEDEISNAKLINEPFRKRKNNLINRMKLALKRRFKKVHQPFFSCPDELQRKLRKLQARNRFLRNKLNTLNVEVSKKNKTLASLITEKNDLKSETIDEAMVMVERAFKDVLRKYFNDRSFIEEETKNDDKICLYAYISFAKGLRKKKGNSSLVTKLKFKEGDHNQNDS